MRSLSDAGRHQRQWLTSEHVYRIVRLSVQDVPQEIKDEFHRFQSDMTKVNVQDLEQSLWATVTAMDDTVVRNMVNCLVRMYDALERHENHSWAQFSGSANLFENKFGV
jgi:hypothetical protein